MHVCAEFALADGSCEMPAEDLEQRHCLLRRRSIESERSRPSMLGWCRVARAFPLAVLIASVAVASFAPACGDETLHLSLANHAGAPNTPASGATGGSEPTPNGGEGPMCGAECEEDLCSSCQPSDIACAPDDFDCAPCERDTDCSERDVCDPLSGRCLRGCGDNDDCPDWRPLCDDGRGVCVDCFRDSHCERSQSCVLGFCVDCAHECR